MHYSIVPERVDNGVVLKLSFGEPGTNVEIVKDVTAILTELKSELGGTTVFLNGPASLPAAVAIAHSVCHLFTEVAVFDPKLQAYVVAVSHGGRGVGELVSP